MASTQQEKIEDRIEFLSERKLPAVITPIAGESLHALLTD